LFSSSFSIFFRTQSLCIVSFWTQNLSFHHLLEGTMSPFPLGLYNFRWNIFMYYITSVSSDNLISPCDIFSSLNYNSLWKLFPPGVS
jgi:hypothetical protein